MKTDWTQFPLPELAHLLEGRANTFSAPPTKKVCTDTRTLTQGDLFFALKGDQFDGHQFLTQALEKGASAVVVQDFEQFQNLSQPAIYVDDTLKALGRLAAYHRQTYSPTVIGITGSNGKTTTKDLLFHLLSTEHLGIKSEKSFNNFIGVPLTLLKIKPEHSFAVIEMGTNHPGEIAYLHSLVQPDFAVITSIGPAHLEGFETVANVAQEKLAITKNVQGFFFPQQEENLLPYLSKLPVPLRPVGPSGQEGITLSNIQWQPSLRFCWNHTWEIETALLGTHNLSNVLLAIALARQLGTSESSIAQALHSFCPPQMRMETQHLREITLINDAYNANPISMKAAIQTLSDLPASGRKILVAGEMGELGKTSIDSHQQIGAYCEEKQLDHILTFGTKAKAMHQSSRFQHFGTHEEILHFLKKNIRQGDIILFKGSRLNQLEKVVQPLVQSLQ